MKVSTRARYGTRAMLDLARSYGKGKVMVKDIAQRQQVSNRYLEQLLFTLKLAGMVKSVRGTGGGFILARAPQEIKVIDIVSCLDGSISPVHCVDHPELYPRADYCATHDLWVDVKKAVEGVLDSVTLKDLLDRQLAKEAMAKNHGKDAMTKAFAKCSE